MTAGHSSYDDLAGDRRDSAKYREGYAEAQRAFLIGQAVRERRLALGLSQTELAARAGMTHPPCPGSRLVASFPPSAAGSDLRSPGCRSHHPDLTPRGLKLAPRSAIAPDHGRSVCLLSAYSLTCRRRYGQTCRGVERPDENPAGHGWPVRRAFMPATFKTEKRG